MKHTIHYSYEVHGYAVVDGRACHQASANFLEEIKKRSRDNECISEIRISVRDGDDSLNSNLGLIEMRNEPKVYRALEQPDNLSEVE